MLPVAAADPPRLVVIVVVDQLRVDFLERFSSHFRAGFQTLLTAGASFGNARYPYFQTDTCPGHFTISTGTLPRTHGMIRNNWWDRDARREFECVEDPSVASVTYGRAATLGNSARRALVPTFAEELVRQRPGGRVVTVSLKARSAIGLSGRKGDAVTWFDEYAGTFVTSRAFAGAPVDKVKAVIDARPFEKDLGAVWQLRDSRAAYRHPDAGVGERPPDGWTGLFPHHVKGRSGADSQFFNLWRRSPLADAYIGYLATSLVDAYGLGTRSGSTDFLGVSFSTLDLVGHLYGPDSREVEDVVARLDDVIGGVIAHLDAKVGRTNYVLAFSADHGTAPIPAPDKGRGRLIGEDVRDRIEETLRARYGAGSEHGSTYTEWNSIGEIYLAKDAAARLANDPVTVQAVQRAVAAIPGVDRLLYTPQLSASSTDLIVRAAALSSVAGRSGDFVAVPERGWSLFPRSSTNASTHGGPYDYDQRVPLILLGGGIRAGARTAPAAPTDIAPTLAVLAGITLPNAEGRVLREALGR